MWRCEHIDCRLTTLDVPPAHLADEVRPEPGVQRSLDGLLLLAGELLPPEHLQATHQVAGLEEGWELYKGKIIIINSNDGHKWEFYLYD